MVYLGKYSVDIFLIHMAISSVFLKDFTYSLRYPVLMFLFVLGVSLVISIIIKLIKVKAKYIFSCAKVYFDS
jgi:peptidoglycan/LPS O-acetylase OafA/YrhL